MPSHEDLMFGRVAVTTGALDASALEESLEELHELEAAGVEASLPKVLLSRRLLTVDRVDEIRLQVKYVALREEEQRIAEWVSREGGLDAGIAEQALARQHAEFLARRALPRRLVDHLAETGLPESQLLLLLGAFPRARLAEVHSHSSDRPTVATPVPAQFRLAPRAGSGSASSPNPRSSAASGPLPCRPQATRDPAGDWVLVEEQGLEPRRRHPVRGSVTLGRSRDCDIQIEDPRVSRHHVRVTARGERCEVTDLGSRTGIQVNGDTAAGTVVLQPGDYLQVGPVLFRVEHSSAGAAEPTAPPPRKHSREVPAGPAVPSRASASASTPPPSGCATPTGGTRFCPQCGETLERDDLFCGRCGRPRR